MTTQNYLMLQNGVVTNLVVWDGNTETWTPPAGATMLVQETTPAIVWQPVVVDKKVTDWVLVEQTGVGGIGFTWNGSALTTNELKPQTTQNP